MLTQKEVVYNAVTSIMGSDFKAGINCAEWFKANPTAKTTLQAVVLEAFTSGKCEIKNEQDNMKTYVSGLITNHLKKDIRLNGGSKYVAKNPGSRAGIVDPQVREARKLLKTLESGSIAAEKTEAFIENRVRELKASKKSIDIDVEALPEELRSLVG